MKLCRLIELIRDAVDTSIFASHCRIDANYSDYLDDADKAWATLQNDLLADPLEVSVQERDLEELRTALNQEKQNG